MKSPHKLIISILLCLSMYTHGVNNSIMSFGMLKNTYSLTHLTAKGNGETAPIKIEYTISGNTLQVNNAGVKSLTLYNAIGQVIVTNTTSSLTMPNQHGLYLLNVTFNNNTQSTQKIIW